MPTNNAAEIVVGLSGGVDSSVSALQLLQQGYRVEALFMKNWEEDDTQDYCAAAEDLADAQTVCETLGIALRTVNFASEYWDRVFTHFLAEYEAGRTPNPDVLCNKEIKFRAFLDFAMSRGADYIATGHYARLARGRESVSLLRGVDPGKDQSYFLHTLGQQQLQAALFPVGDLHKSEVREIAKSAGLSTSEKKDSTGICFVGERRFSKFLQRYLPAQPGEIVTESGSVIGMHQGLMFYTIGQRKGMAVGGLADYTDAPWYVVAKNSSRNRLIVAQGHDHPLLLRDTLSAQQVHWIAGRAPPLPLDCTAKVRYRQLDVPCRVTAGTESDVNVAFDTPVRAITPGQSIVFYADDVCLGGGIIE
ncbi:MAG: tRNA 2-thiouridine(34) synthase MnmA [Gammaproteobacteria bacterium]|nr:tRNA 2-thiouridine(34) synthase MnmA [Gammaproteobacteria bacterium]